VNYEPNSWGGALGGPRESPDRGFTSFPSDEGGQKVRLRSETFADHYSQARQFFISQTETEQNHIVSAFIFELSKVETPAIRARMVSHLLNIDEDLATKVAQGLRLREMPAPADAARPRRDDLEPSQALSIILNGPQRLTGRKVGALLTDGADAGLLAALKGALDKEGVLLEIIAPAIGGVEASDGTWIEADQKIDGGPSVLYDAVVLLVSEDGAAQLANEAAARDFVADAFAHLKFIGYVPAAQPLLDKAGVVPDDGVVQLAKKTDVTAFLKACRDLRLWAREPNVKVLVPA
jgi:catalase